jgi:hypothetical protein
MGLFKSGGIIVGTCINCEKLQGQVSELSKKIVQLESRLAAMRGALEIAKDYLYNPFEPDKQSNQYKIIEDALQFAPDRRQ